MDSKKLKEEIDRLVGLADGHQFVGKLHFILSEMLDHIEYATIRAESADDTVFEHMNEDHE